jgi:cell division protein FtsZ
VSGEVNVDFADVRTIMACRGPALMGSGFGEGDDRAVEAAQEAISSPLLDEVSIEGARGVLINITGGMDLAIDEVSQISSIIQEEAGDEAEIIFGAVHDPALEGQVRVTVIATGFDRAEADEEKIIRPEFTRPAKPQVQEQVQIPVQQPMRAVAVGGSSEPMEMPLQRFPDRVVTTEQIRELDIPTFIRRQMD